MTRGHASFVLVALFVASFRCFCSPVEATRNRFKQLVLQEKESPAGPKHSAGIRYLNGSSYDEGTTVGLIYFYNDLFFPKDGGKLGNVPAGVESGHCVQVSKEYLACYFNFNVTGSRVGSGRITAEALFLLKDFSASLVITGGTGDFLGIIGDGVVTFPSDNSASDFRVNYNLKFRISDD